MRAEQGRRRCPRCQLDLALTDFTALPSGKVAGYCKDCVNAAKRERYATRPDVRERARAQARAWQADHPDWRKRSGS